MRNELTEFSADLCGIGSVGCRADLGWSGYMFTGTLAASILKHQETCSSLVEESSNSIHLKLLGMRYTMQVLSSPMTTIAGDRLMNLAFPIDRETRHRRRPFAYEYFTQKRSSGNNTWIIVQRSSARHCWLRRLYELQPMVQNGAVLWLNWIALQKPVPLSSEYMREHQRLSRWSEDALTAASRCDPQWPGGKSSSR